MKKFVKENLLWIKFTLFSLLGSLLFINFAGGNLYQFSAFEFEVDYALFSRGGTTLILPPLGQIYAATHSIPLHIIFRLQFVDINLLEGIIGSTQDYNEILLQEGRRIMLYSLVRVSLLSVVGSMLSVYLLVSRKKNILIKAAVLGLVTVVLIFGLTYLVYDFDAYQDPVYFGTLEAAPWMVGLIEESLYRIEELGEKLQLMAENLFLFYDKIDDLQPLGRVNGELIVLHVSDLHNNIAALDFIEQIIKNFEVDLVIDTGDIVDYGTPVEVELISGINNLDLPYIFVPGNHDSPQVIDTLEEYENVYILRDHLFFSGLHIAGIPDPLSSTMEFRSPSISEVEKYAARLKTNISGNAPHIIAVHNHRIADRVADLAPITLFGHTHQKEVIIEEDSVRINAGTSGAAGIRTLETSVGSPPYTMVLLRFNREEKFNLLAVDTIKVLDQKSGFTLNRYLINMELH